MRKVIVSLIIVILLITMTTPVMAAGVKEPVIQVYKTGDKIVVAADAVATCTGYNAKTGLYGWKLKIGDLQYLDDLKTEIDCHWYQDGNGYYSGDNLFDATVNGTQVSITHDGYSKTYNPTITINGQSVPASSATPHIILLDRINSNYRLNTISWNYGDNITRYLRLIEGVISDYYVIESMPSGDVVININATTERRFDGNTGNSAWDDNDNSINIRSGDDQLFIDVTDLQDADFPVTIDPTTNFYTSASDGVMAMVGSPLTWTTIHDWATYPYAVDKTGVTLTTMVAGASATSNGIGRSWLYFDTSAIPDALTITDATLYLYGSSVQTDIGTWTLQVQSGMPTYPHDPLVSGDFNYTYYAGSGGTISSSSISTGTYNAITLNATGKGWINKTGTTKFILRELEHDINDVTPPQVGSYKYNRFIYYSYEQGAGYRPYLEVTYTAISPTVTTDAASNIASTTARLNSTIVSDGGGDCEVRFGWDDTGSRAAITDYDDYTSWSGSYNTGEHPYLDIDSLTPDTQYYFAVEIQNDEGSDLGTELNFTTSAVCGDPDNLRAYPSDTSISFSWVKGDGSTNSTLRYKTGSYPTDETDGTEAYFGTSASYNVTGLTRGTTYYFSVWGESGGGYSADSSDVLATTLAASAGGTDLDNPDTPSRWMDEPAYTNLSNLPLIYPAVNNMADTISMPRATMWLIMFILLAVSMGIMFYQASKGKTAIGVIGVTVGLGMGYAAGIIPLWIPVLSLIIAVSLLWIQRREAY